MNRSITSALLMLVVTIALSAVAFAADNDPAMGTWQLNLSKSTFSAGTAPKSQTRVYSKSGQSITLLITGVGADGSQTKVQTTYQINGKAYPISGTADYDSLTAKQINPSSAVFVLMKSGAKVGTTDRRVTADGKTLTAKTRLTLASGAKIESTAVFDKQ